MEYLGTWGTLIHENNLKLKISCQTPFNLEGCQAFCQQQPRWLILSVQGSLKAILTSASHPFEQGCQLY